MKHTFLFLSLLCCSSCALFKKTSKSSNVITQSSKKQLESSRLVLKQVGKETQTFTYWTDSGFYQYQLIKEQMDQVKSDEVTVEKQQKSKGTQTIKETKPVFVWGGVILIIFFFLVFRLCRRCLRI